MSSKEGDVHENLNVLCPVTIVSLLQSPSQWLHVGISDKSLP